MDDLGDPYEVEVDHFICPKRGRNTILKEVTPLPSNYSNLLASTSRYNHAFVASPATISVYSLHDLRNPDSHAEPCAIVNLGSLDVAEIRHVLLTLADTVLAVLAASAQDSTATKLVFLHISALVAGRIHTIPAPDTANIRAIAVSPAPPDETQPLFVCLTKTHVVVYRLGGQSAELMKEIPIQDAPCVAISHEEKLIAASTTRGSVALFNPISGESVGTVVEVESGWQPFQLHFAGADYLFTAYESGQSTYDVIWHLKFAEHSVQVSGKSPLGELCYPLMLDDEEEDSRPRSIMFAYIAEWHLAVVASSMSCDLDIVVLLENGSWGLWKLPEGFMPSLPMDNNEEDTTAFGLALDFADTSRVPPREQGASSISPMPGIIVMSSDSVVLSFRLVDLRSDARCDTIREPDCIPPLPISNATAHLKLPALATPDSSAEDAVSSQGFATPFHELVYGPIAESGDQVSQTDQPSQSVELGDDNEPNQQLVDLSTVPQTSTNFNPPDLNLFSENPFTGTKPFLSNFNFPPPPSSSRASRKSSNTAAPSEQVLTRDPFASSRPASTGRPPLWNAKAVPSVQNVSQPILATVDLHPRLSEARAAIKEDASIDPHDCVRSILKEMSEEFSVVLKSSEVMSTELEAMKSQVVVKTENTTDALSNFRRDIRNAYQVELEVRTLATQKLKEVIRLHEGYESLRLGRDVALEEGISKSLSAEYRSMDQQMSRKEAEIEKLIRSIEDKLQSHELERKKRMDPGHVLQTIYSTISLQGLRIKRLLNLLKALTQRVEEGILDRRRSSLGLTIARLENLSLGLDATGVEDDVVQATNKQSNGSTSTDSVPAPRGQGSSRIEDDQEGKADSISSIFRKLAMRDGRARILAETTYREGAFGANGMAETTLKPTNKANSSASKRTGGIAEPSKPGTSFPIDRSMVPTNVQKAQSLPKVSESVSLASNTASSKPPISGTQSRKDNVFGKPQKSNRQSFELARSKNTQPAFNTTPRANDATSSSIDSTRNSTKRPANSQLTSEKSHSKPDQSSSTDESVNISSSADDSSLPTIDITSPARIKRVPWPSVQMSISQQPIPMRKSPPNLSPSGTGQRVQFADSPPNDDVRKRPSSISSNPSVGAATPTEDKKHQTSSKREGLFAQLPPDDDGSSKKRASDAGISKGPAGDASKQSMPGSLFAALPPDDPTSVEKPQSEPPASNQDGLNKNNTNQTVRNPFETSAPSFTSTKAEAPESNPFFLKQAPENKTHDDKTITPVKTEPTNSTTIESITSNKLSSPQTPRNAVEENKTSFGSAGDASTISRNETGALNFGDFNSQLNLGGQSAPPFLGNANTPTSSSAETAYAPPTFGNASNATANNPFGGASFGSQSGFGSNAGGGVPFNTSVFSGGSANIVDPGKQSASNVMNSNDGTSSDDSDKDVRLDQPQRMEPITPGGGSSSFPFGNTGNTGTSGNFGDSRESSNPFGTFGGRNANTPSETRGFGNVESNIGNAGVGGGQPSLGFNSGTPPQVSGTGLFGSMGTGIQGNNGGSGFGANAFGSSGGIESSPAPTFGATNALGSNMGGFGGSNMQGSPPWPAASSSVFGMSSQLGAGSSGAGGNFGGSSSFGMTSTFGATSTFGMASPIGGGGSGGGGFDGMSSTMGQNSFGGMNANSSSFGGGGFGGAAPASVSPFGAVGAASGQGFGNSMQFGAQNSSPSGFASIASSGSGLMFGDGKPPAFTSPAFSERRA